MLIFDGFPTRDNAERFVVYCRVQGLGVYICSSQEESNGIDPFPFVLDPPIVLVERGTMRYEREIERVGVERFAGRFAGT